MIDFAAIKSKCATMDAEDALAYTLSLLQRMAADEQPERDIDALGRFTAFERDILLVLRRATKPVPCCDLLDIVNEGRDRPSPATSLKATISKIRRKVGADVVPLGYCGYTLELGAVASSPASDTPAAISSQRAAGGHIHG